MSSDVYLDFHTPELYLIYNESWSKWYSKLVNLELQFQGKEFYFAERISHLSNLIIESNIDNWELFREEFNGQLIDRHLIGKIINEWREFYQESQKPENLQSCQPRDIMTSGQIKIILKKYNGYHLVFRTN